MARIISYPVLSTVSSGDWIPITDTSVTGNPLKNVTVEDLQSFIIQGSTLQSVITAGNTYQGGTGPLWTWDTSGLTAASTGLSTFLSDRAFRATSLLNSSYTEIRPAEIEMSDSSGNNSLLIPNSSLASSVTLQMPLASGVLALTTDIPASPWVPVTGGINYPTNRVGINTALPLEALDVTGNVSVSGKIEAPNIYGRLNGTISSNTTGTTQATTDNSTKVATTAFVSNAVGAIPSGLTFQGDWDALNNTPNIGASTPDNGDFYIVSVAGTTNLGGITDWEVGDWAIAVVSGGVTVWQKIDNSSVLTGTGTGTKMAKWAGTGTSVTLTDSAIEEIAGTNGQSNIGINTTPDPEASIYNGYSTGDVAETIGIKNKAANANTNAAINANVYGITSDATSSQTVGSAGNTQAIRLVARHEGVSSVAFVVGSNAKATITNGGSPTSGNVYGNYATAEAIGTNISNSKYNIGSFVTAKIDNPSHAAINFIGAYVDLNPSQGTAQDMVVLQVNNQGTPPSNAFDLTGDLTYLKITQGTMASVGGTARAIHSEVTLPSLLLGSLESTGFIKTGGAATEFLMADGSVSTGSLVGSIPTEQIAFGNAGGDGITSSANLEFDDTFKVLTIKGTSVGQTIVRDDNVLVTKDASTRIGIGISTIPRVQLSQGNVNTYLQLIGTPTQENTISLPDKSGTVALLDDVVGSVTGTGNAGHIPLWSGATALTDSAVFQNGTSVGIGTITPGAQLETTEGIIVQGMNISAPQGQTFKNTAVGYQTMQSNTTGVSNIAIGYQALISNSNGDENVAIGSGAMAFNSSGDDNIAIGKSTLNNNTAGNQNIAIGTDALRSNSTSGSLAIGHEALYANTTGSANMALGNSALRSNTTGIHNIVVGRSAGRSIVDGSNNTLVGYRAGFTNISGLSNTYIGEDTGLSALGSENSAVGRKALNQLSSGDGNTALGYNSGTLVSGGTGNTSATDSIFIGKDAKALGTGETNQIVIGADAIGLGSNTATIGTPSITETRLHGDINVANGDVDIAIGQGVILRSPNGTKYRITVDNAGALGTTLVP